MLKITALAAAFSVALLAAPVAAPVAAHAQSAPGVSGVTLQTDFQVSQGRSLAGAFAAQGEQVRMTREALEQQAQIIALQEAQFAAQQAQAQSQSASGMEFVATEDGGVAFTIPTGGGLIPGGSASAGPGSVTYVVNIQNGDGNVASNTVIEQSAGGAIEN